MFEEPVLMKAVDIQQRTYHLLRWLETAVSRGFVRVATAHRYVSDEAAVAAWIEQHYLNMPPNARPGSLDKDSLRPFAAFVTSYLKATFEFQEEPPDRLASECGCFCPWCAYVARGKHLKTKRVGKADKTRARRLKLGCLRQLALDAGRQLSEGQAQRLLDDPDLREALALTAYGEQLVRRMQGQCAGVAVLALWREFAWTPAGSPKHGFHLSASQIVHAEKMVVKHIEAVCRT